MKRRVFIAILVFISLIALSSCAAAKEILFRNVPWGVNPSEARKKIDNPNLFMQYTFTNGTLGYPSKSAERLLDHSKNVVSGNPEFFNQKDTMVRVSSVYLSEEARFEGHKLYRVDMYFANDLKNGVIDLDVDASHFAVAQYTFDPLEEREAFLDLQSRLDSAYGSGEKQNGTYSGSLWVDGQSYGYTNNTDIVTYTGDNGTHAQLVCTETIGDDEPDAPAYQITLTYWCDTYEAMLKEADSILSNQPDDYVRNGLELGIDGVWYLYKDGEIDPATYGIVEYNGGRFFVANGTVISSSGLVSDGTCWYYLSNGQVADYTGLAQYDGAWFYVENGILDPVRSGIVSYDGSLFMLAAGRLATEANGLIQDPSSRSWYFCSGGQVQSAYRGLALYDEHWFYIWDGVFQSDAEGWVEHNGETFYVMNGMLME